MEKELKETNKLRDELIVYDPKTGLELDVILKLMDCIEITESEDVTNK